MGEHVPRPLQLSLDTFAAGDPRLVGAKAANLAVAAQAGLSVLPGMILTTAARSAWPTTGPRPSALERALRAVWKTVSDGGRRSLVVRSSSTVEDSATSSMAGRFTSVLDVTDWSSFLAAVETVLGSAADVEDHPTAPMAVLVQPHLAPAQGGVLFGADPVSGNVEHLVVASADGGPEGIVSGEDQGRTTTLTRKGRLVKGAFLDRRTRRHLARLAIRTEEIFGSPQDMEWAIDRGGKLWLLQSRPITTPLRQPIGPRLAPGPVAETLPEALTPLERDLWVDPLRDGLREALALTGTVSGRELRRSPVVVTVEGRAAVDSDLIEARRPSGLLGRLDPRPPVRRLRAAWRVGRLRAALPVLAEDLVGEVDIDLMAVPTLGELTDRELFGVLHTTRHALTTLHAYEIVTGLLLPTETTGPTGAALALHALAEGRARGLDDSALIGHDPVVLALVPPSVGPVPVLPTNVIAPPPMNRTRDQAGLARETLRVRIRWVQELAARAAWELAARLDSTGRIAERRLVRWLTLEELEAVAGGAKAPTDLATRPVPSPDPLPASFRLTADGTVVPDTATDRTAQGAAGGRGRGPVHVGPQPTSGAVLVVGTLDPALAGVLPGLAGLVAETGSPLSHLAILAREYGVPTVVGVADARRRFRQGEMVTVDGTTGSVDRAEPGTEGRAEPDLADDSARNDETYANVSPGSTS